MIYLVVLVARGTFKFFYYLMYVTFLAIFGMIALMWIALVWSLRLVGVTIGGSIDMASRHRSMRQSMAGGQRSLTSVESAPAGWYPNPEAPGQRYWDGRAWTGYTGP